MIGRNVRINAFFAVKIGFIKRLVGVVENTDHRNLYKCRTCLVDIAESHRRFVGAKFDAFRRVEGIQRVIYLILCQYPTACGNAQKILESVDVHAQFAVKSPFDLGQVGFLRKVGHFVQKHSVQFALVKRGDKR